MVEKREVTDGFSQGEAGQATVHPAEDEAGHSRGVDICVSNSDEELIKDADALITQRVEGFRRSLAVILAEANHPDGRGLAVPRILGLDSEVSRYTNVAGAMEKLRLASQKHFPFLLERVSSEVQQEIVGSIDEIPSLTKEALKELRILLSEGKEELAGKDGLTRHTFMEKVMLDKEHASPAIVEYFSDSNNRHILMELMEEPIQSQACQELTSRLEETLSRHLLASVGNPPEQEIAIEARLIARKYIAAFLANKEHFMPLSGQAMKGLLGVKVEDPSDWENRDDIAIMEYSFDGGLSHRKVNPSMLDAEQKKMVNKELASGLVDARVITVQAMLDAFRDIKQGMKIRANAALPDDVTDKKSHKGPLHWYSLVISGDVGRTVKVEMIEQESRKPHPLSGRVLYPEPVPGHEKDPQLLEAIIRSMSADFVPDFTEYARKEFPQAIPVGADKRE